MSRFRALVGTGACVAVAWLAVAPVPPAQAQGCVSARHISFGSGQFGAEDIKFFQPREWELSLSYRGLRAEDAFVGKKEIKAAKRNNVNAVGDFNSVDVNLAYAISHRWSVGISIPLLHGQANVVQGDGQRHSFSSGLKVGDVRLMGNAWIFDPNKPRSGNLVLSLGIKAPTGKHDVKDEFYTAQGRTVLPIDISTQPGDNGWGIIAQAQGFQVLASRTFFYGNGFYLFNPKEKNDTVTPASAPHTLSIADQYMARAGVGYAAWREKEINLSLGFRIEGVTRKDLFGGDGGFRRPGYVLSTEPGVTISRGPHVLSVYVPISVERNRQQNVIEEALSRETGTNVNGGGALPAYSVLLTYSRRFAGKSQVIRSSG